MALVLALDATSADANTAAASPAAVEFGAAGAAVGWVPASWLTLLLPIGLHCCSCSCCRHVWRSVTCYCQGFCCASGTAAAEVFLLQLYHPLQLLFLLVLLPAVSAGVQAGPGCLTCSAYCWCWPCCVSWIRRLCQCCSLRCAAAIMSISATSPAAAGTAADVMWALLGQSGAAGWCCWRLTG
jgi:hypothetical protein